jgi:Type IV secretion-system coupling protein DNA-binding domain
MSNRNVLPFEAVRGLASPPASLDRVLEIPRFEKSVMRDFAGLNATAADIARGLLASPVQLDALLGGLMPGELLIAHLDFSAARTSGLAVEIVARGDTSKSALKRATVLGDLLDAALASGLPCVDIRPRTKRFSVNRLEHACTLAPAGFALPLSTAPIQVRTGDPKSKGQSVIDWSETQRDVLVLSVNANGPHLAGLGAALGAIKTPIAIEVRMSGKTFEPQLLRQIDDMRTRVHDRHLFDAEKYVRDSRYTDADRRLENLIIAGAGTQLDVIVRSKRELELCEVSAISAALFGAPHAVDQRGHLSSMRQLYPREDAVMSFFGIVAAAILPAIERRQVQQLDDLAGHIIGKTKAGQVIRMAVEKPRSHTYMIGRPGSGKSTLMLNLILQDIEAGQAVVLIDPHGDLWSDVRARIPAHRAADVQLVHMGEPGLQPQLNLLELGPGDPAEARARVVDTIYQLVRRLMYSGLTTDATGPMFNKYFRAALMLLMEGEGENAQFQMIERVFSDKRYRRELISRESVSAETRMQWEQILGVESNDHSIESVTPWITSKLTQITQSAILRPILGALTTSLDFDEVLKTKRICLINLANGRIGTEAAGLLGGVLTHRLEQSAKRQEALSAELRHSASIYFDEFHTFASEFLRPLMAECRKFGLRVTLANQTLSQMINNDIEGGVFREVLGTCANTVAFAIDHEDARYLAPRFGGRVEPCSMVAQSNFQAICQFQTEKGSLGPFVVRTLPPPPPNKAT